MPEGGYYEIKNAPLELQTLPDGQSGWNMGRRYVLWMERRLELKIFPRLREILVGVQTFRKIFDFEKNSQKFYRDFDDSLYNVL